MTKKVPGGCTDPSNVPQLGHGGHNSRGGSKKQGKEGNGAEKLQQKKK
jgi:hypothetical protein